VFPAEGTNDAPLEEIGTQLGERPAPVGQPDLGGRGFRQAADVGDLGGADPHARAHHRRVLHGRHALLLEGVEIGVDGVAMDLQHTRDRLAIKASRVEEDRLGTPALPGLQRPLEQAVDLAQLSGPRFGDGQGTRHV
jgi:hypothetical protein